ncbi:PTS system galactitol-specific EIIC component [Mycobacteroides abscessus subsp. abscessus]|nr:PTS system galactitol-specific EIIC component [Mycobacteroides abscessus subsp. abscessus]
METIVGVAHYITDLGAAIALPVIITLFGWFLGLPFSKAFRSGLTIGVGFIGVGLIITLMSDQVSPAAQSMAGRFGVGLDIVDVGWPYMGAAAYATLYGAAIIPLVAGMNLLYLALGLTRTFNIDLWNYWTSAFVGALVGEVTGSFIWGLVGAAAHMTFMLALADLTAPIFQKYFELPGLSLAHGTSSPYGLFAIPLNWLFDRIPGFKKLDATPETIQRRLGIFGEPVMMGLILGLFIGTLSFAGTSTPPDDIKKILTLAVSMAAVMYLLPQMVGVLVGGLLPISEAAQAFVKKRFPSRTLYIGVDSAVAVGRPAVIASGLLLVPITLALAIALEPFGNRVLPLVDLAATPFIVALMVAVFRGNIIRTVVGATILLVPGLFMATWVAPLFTTVAASAPVGTDAGSGTVVSLTPGANPANWIYPAMASLGCWWVAAAAALSFAALVAVSLHNKRSDRISAQGYSSVG